MCAHYTFFISTRELADIVAKAEERLRRINPAYQMTFEDIYPKSIAPVLVPRQGVLEPMPMRWGYPVRRPKKRQGGDEPQYTTQYFQNARIETADTAGLWRDSLPARRCLIPATGFYEWRDTGGSKKQEVRFTQPGVQVFYIAGLYKMFGEPDGTRMPHYAMLTTQPNDFVRPIHSRMPLVLLQNEQDTWLQGDYHLLLDRQKITLHIDE